MLKIILPLPKQQHPAKELPIHPAPNAPETPPTPPSYVTSLMIHNTSARSVVVGHSHPHKHRSIISRLTPILSSDPNGRRDQKIDIISSRRTDRVIWSEQRCKPSRARTDPFENLKPTLTAFAVDSQNVQTSDSPIEDVHADTTTLSSQKKRQARLFQPQCSPSSD
jgi:hypothetical protein